MKFKVGQVWKDKGNEEWEITNILSDGTNFPITAVNTLTGSTIDFTIQGNYWGKDESLNDLVELVSPSMKDWKIVEEPKHKTYYVNVFEDGLYGSLSQKVYREEIAKLEITLDENGKLISAKNV